jgi:GcrA cell cycle regulator
LWDSGITANEMARQLGTTKNAIVGRAHRLGLTPRASPIVHRGAPRTAPKPKRAIPPLPPLASLVPDTVAPRVDVVAPIKPAIPPIERHARVEPCCWITTEGGRGRAWLYCNAESMPDRPYCKTHAVRAWPALKRHAESMAHDASAGGRN